jgi:hypothetical protein
MQNFGSGFWLLLGVNRKPLEGLNRRMEESHSSDYNLEITLRRARVEAATQEAIITAGSD